MRWLLTLWLAAIPAYGQVVQIHPTTPTVTVINAATTTAEGGGVQVLDNRVEIYFFGPDGAWEWCGGWGIDPLQPMASVELEAACLGGAMLVIAKRDVVIKAGSNTMRSRGAKPEVYQLGEVANEFRSYNPDK